MAHKTAYEGELSAGWRNEMAAGRLTVLVLAAIFSVLIQSCANQPSTTASDEPLAYKLAVLNANGYVDKTDVTVARFQYLLAYISLHTGSSEEEIGDMTVYAQQRLRATCGKEVGLLDLMEAAKEAVSGHKTKWRYQDVMALLAASLCE